MSSMPKKSRDPEWLQKVTFSELLLDSPIREEDLKEVFTALMKDSSGWYAIGVALGVPVNKLNEIASDNSMAATKLAQMVDYWIRNGEIHNWRSLIAALFKIGHKAAGEAVILCAENALFGDPSPSKRPLPDLDLVKEDKKHSDRESSFKPAMFRIDAREQELYEKLAQLLGMASGCHSNDSLLDDINRHILNNPDLTRHELREIVLTINLISEESKHRSKILQKHTQALEEDVKNSGKIQAELIMAKQDLQEQLFNLNKEVEDIEVAYDKDNSIQDLLEALKEKENIIRGVQGQIEQCIQDLCYANCSYQALSNSLNECSLLLKRTLRQNDRLKAITTSSRDLTKVFYNPHQIIGLVGISIMLWLLVGTSHGEVEPKFNLLIILLPISFIIIKVGDYIMVHILHQRTINHSRVSKTWKYLISSCGVVLSFLLGIFITVNPTDTHNVVSSTGFGLMAAVGFSKVYRSPHILVYRATCYHIAVTGVTYVSSFTNKDSDGNYHQPQPLSIATALLFGSLFGLVYTLFTLNTEEVKAGHLEDPIHHELVLIVVGAVVGYCSNFAVTQDRAAFRMASTFGNVTGIFIGLFLYKKKILFESPPEDNVLNASMKILDESDEILTSTVKKIKELQTELVAMDHPYGSKQPCDELVLFPLRHRLSRSISHLTT